MVAGLAASVMVDLSGAIWSPPRQAALRTKMKARNITPTAGATNRRLRTIFIMTVVTPFRGIASPRNHHSE